MIEKNIIINGLNIHFYQSDKLITDETVVFLHGWGSEAFHMKSIFEKSDNFIAVDLPGFGRSERPISAWTTFDYADFLKKFLLKLKISEPILAGHSFGGSVIIKYCSAGSEVKKIILIGSAGVRRKSSRLHFYKIGSKIFNLVFSLPILSGFRNISRKKFYKTIGNEDYLNAGEMKEIFQKVINDDLTEDIKKINTETILIWGENDEETPVEDAKKMHKLIGDSKLFIIPKAGHYVFLDNKDEFNKIFFKQIV